MPPEDIKLFPFLTREMLRFGSESELTLQVRSRSTGANDVSIRGLTREGIFGFNHTTLGVGGTFIQSFRIPDIPISLIVLSDSTTIEQGEIFVEITLEVNGDPVVILASGYIYGIHSIGWPTPGAIDSRPGGGFVSIIESADPALGAELTDIVNGNELWRIISVRFNLDTDANAGTRTPHLVITDGTNTLFDIIASTGAGPATAFDFSWVTAGEPSDPTDNDDIVTGLPPNILLPNPFTITTETTNLLAGDNYTVMRMLVERWLV